MSFKSLLTKKAYKGIAAMLILGGCMTVLGCGDSKPKQEASKTKQEAMTANAKAIYPFEAVAEIKPERKNVYAALKVIKGPYWSDLVRGLKESGEAANVNVYVGGPGIETDWQGQKKMLDDLAGKKVDAVIMAPCDSDNMIPVAMQLKEKKLPVILVDTPLKDKAYDVLYSTDNVAAGAKAAEEMLNILRKAGVKDSEKVTIAIAASSFNSKTLLDRSVGIKKYWSEKAPANWTIKPEALINYSDAKLAQNLAAEAVKKDASLRGFISVNNGSTVNTCKFLMESKNDKLCLVGFDYSKEIAGLIADPKFNASSVVQNQYNMGVEAVKTAVQMLNGQKPAKQDVDTGVKIVNIDNYKEFSK